MEKRNIISVIIITIFAIFSLVGCGAPKTVQNQQMTLNFSFGEKTGTYTGEVNAQNLPDGKGKFETKNSENKIWIYEGDFKNGHFEGQGKTTWPELNMTVEGTYHNDKLNGQGKRTLPNGKVEEGNYSDGMLNGQGKITVQNNGKTDVFESNFVAGVPMKAESVGLNTEVTFAQWTYKVNGISVQKTIGNKQASGMYIILSMDAQNNGNSARQPGSRDFYSIVDTSNGRVFKMDDNAMMSLRFADRSHGDWYLTEVNPGNKARDFAIVWDIPEDTDINNLVLLPTQSNGNVTPIKLQIQ